MWYVPYEQQPNVKYLDLYVRTGGGPGAFAPAVRRAIASVDPGVALFDLRTQREQIDALLAPERMLAVLASFFAATAVVLAALGLHAAVAFAVVRRRRDFAIRIALGAHSASVAGLVTGEIARLVAVGIVVGAAAAGALSRSVASILYQTSPLDPVSMGGAALAMASMAALAAAVPVWRAVHTDPAIALRSDQGDW